MTDKATNELRINADRLWDSLMEMAKIGATEKGGVCRLALTDLDKEGRDLFVRWCEEAGCTVAVDAMGNMFARRPGRRGDLHPVGAGSHLDSQPTGGKFDGVYGVLAALEVVRTLNDHGVETDAPVEVVVWTNEEGARFAPAMVGAGVFGGAFDLDYGLSRQDKDGKTIGEELKRIGYAGDKPVGNHPFRAFFEAHIEQGPILEAEEKTIGVVTGVQGIRWYDLVITGAETHAGPTPMDMRRDPLRDGLKLIERIYQLAWDRAPEGRATIGECEARPGSRNTVPGSLRLTVDLRHPDPRMLDAMDRDLRALCEGYPATSKLGVSLDEIWHSPPIAFDETCVKAVRGAVERLGYPFRDMVSGAGHDAVYVSKVSPTAMIFVPCEDGVSHNEAENATPEDLAAGCNVLLHAMLSRTDG